MYALTKANSFIRELIGGISTEISSNINSLKYLVPLLVIFHLHEMMVYFTQQSFLYSKNIQF